jgi:hypothetical protein
MSLVAYIPEHRIDRFSYHPDDNLLLADFSDFNGKTIDTRLFDDAIDVGFYIINTRTQSRILFTHSRDIFTEKQDVFDNDKEFIAREWVAADPQYQKNYMTDRLSNLRVQLFND